MYLPDIDETGILILSYESKGFPIIRLVNKELEYDKEISFDKYRSEVLPLMIRLEKWLDNEDIERFYLGELNVFTDNRSNPYRRCVTFTTGEHSISLVSSDVKRLLNLFWILDDTDF